MAITYSGHKYNWGLSLHRGGTEQVVACLIMLGFTTVIVDAEGELQVKHCQGGAAGRGGIPQ